MAPISARRFWMAWPSEANVEVADIDPTPENAMTVLRAPDFTDRGIITPDSGNVEGGAEVSHAVEAPPARAGPRTRRRPRPRGRKASGSPAVGHWIPTNSSNTLWHLIGQGPNLPKNQARCSGWHASESFLSETSRLRVVGCSCTGPPLRMRGRQQRFSGQRPNPSVLLNLVGFRQLYSLHRSRRRHCSMRGHRPGNRQLLFRGDMDSERGHDLFRWTVHCARISRKRHRHRNQYPGHKQVRRGLPHGAGSRARSVHHDLGLSHLQSHHCECGERDIDVRGYRAGDRQL